jgi:type I restriction enzyme S subunit
MGATFMGLSGKTKEDFGHGDAEFITSHTNVFANPIAANDGTESVAIDDKQKHG